MEEETYIIIANEHRKKKRYNENETMRLNALLDALAESKSVNWKLAFSLFKVRHVVKKWPRA